VNKPEGERFSHVYLDRGEPVADSARVRVRMRSLVWSIRELRASQVVEEQLGIEFSTWEDFFKRAETRDILDFVTVAYRFLAGKQYTGEHLSRQWLLDIQRIFQEENIHYKVDHKGGAHFHFDEEFARAAAAAISILQNRRYANSLDGFNQSLVALAEGPPNGKAAIRATFAAIEGLFSLMFPEVRRLAAGEVSRLRPLLTQVYSGDRRAQEASDKMLQSLRGWIDAAHEYRHEEGKPDTIAQPPLTLAVYLVSSGATHVRWLAELDMAVTQATAPT
jgi:hypothetical protein